MQGRGDITDMGFLGGQSVLIWVATEGEITASDASGRARVVNSERGDDRTGH